MPRAPSQAISALGNTAVTFGEKACTRSATGGPPRAKHRWCWRANTHMRADTAFKAHAVCGNAESGQEESFALLAGAWKQAEK